MNWTALLILPLVGGYALSTIWEGSVYYSARESGHRLYFRAVFYGVFLIVCASVLHIYLLSVSDTYGAYLNLINKTINHGVPNTGSFKQSSYVSVLALSFLLGPLIALILNIPKLLARLRVKPFVWWQHFLLERAIKNNDFEIAVLKSLDNGLPMLLTLSSGKIYLGWAVKAPNPIEQRKAVRILPLMSGYRDEKHRAEFTTEYLSILQLVQDQEDNELGHLDKSDFELVIPTDQIVSTRLFDIAAYRRFRSDEGEDNVGE